MALLAIDSVLSRLAQADGASAAVLYWKGSLGTRPPGRAFSPPTLLFASFVSKVRSGMDGPSLEDHGVSEGCHPVTRR